MYFVVDNFDWFAFAVESRKNQVDDDIIGPPPHLKCIKIICFLPKKTSSSPLDILFVILPIFPNSMDPEFLKKTE